MGFGAGLGLGYGYWGWPGYYDGYYDSPDADAGILPVVPAAPAPQQGQVPAQYYYCDNPSGYYPFVASCQSPWRPVPIAPPPH